jgi:hypothetical protein
MMSDNDSLNQDRVRRHTSGETLAAIDDATRCNIRYYAAQPRQVLDERIEALERERDMEQMLETNAAVLAAGGTLLGMFVNRKWFLLPAAVLGFLSQHATTGWCPPVPVMRKLGVRTRSEINQEKYALKALRGDFGVLAAERRPERALAAVET